MKPTSSSLFHLLFNSFLLCFLLNSIHLAAQKTTSVKPQTKPISKTVHVTQPGSLETFLTAAEKSSVVTLIVEGMIDQRDIEFMNHKMPVLSSIDLSHSDIAAYNEFKANALPRAAFEESYDGEKVRLKSVVLPSGLLYIETSAFLHCKALSTLIIPESVRGFGGMALYGSGIQTISLPNSFQADWSFLEDCQKLESIWISPSNQRYTTFNGLVYSRNYDTLFFCPRGRTDDFSDFEISIHDVKVIGKEAFRDCQKLHGNPGLPFSLIEIQENAFRDCKGMTGELEINSTIKRIGEYAFANCTNLTKITVDLKKAFDDPDTQGTYYNAYNAFEGCEQKVIIKKELSSTDQSFLAVQASQPKGPTSHQLPRYNDITNAGRENIYYEDFSTNSRLKGWGTNSDCRVFEWFPGYYMIKSVCSNVRNEVIINQNTDNQLGFRIDQKRDFEIEVNFCFIAGEDNNANMIHWGRNRDGSRLDFGISGNGQYIIGNAPSNSTRNDLKTWTASEFIRKFQFNKLTIRKNGIYNQFFINEVLVHQCPVQLFYGDLIAIQCNNNSTLLIDYIRVSYLK